MKPFLRMCQSNTGRVLVGLIAAACLCPIAAFAEEPATIPLKGLPPDSRLAVWGDSITEMTLYPQFVETYLLACAGRKDVKVCRCAIRGAQKNHRLRQRRRIRGGKAECPECPPWPSSPSAFRSGPAADPPWPTPAGSVRLR
jgi:hypothetical protein